YMHEVCAEPLLVTLLHLCPARITPIHHTRCGGKATHRATALRAALALPHIRCTTPVPGLISIMRSPCKTACIARGSRPRLKLRLCSTFVGLILRARVFNASQFHRAL